MNGEIPTVYWLVFWTVLWVLGLGAALTGGLLGYRARIRMLDILKIYAERGDEPPATLVEPLLREASKPEAHKWPEPGSRQDLLGKFSFGVFMAGVMAGLAWWRIDVGGPQWAIYVTVIAAIVFGVGALGSLIAACFSIAASIAASLAENRPCPKDDGRG